MKRLFLIFTLASLALTISATEKQIVTSDGVSLYVNVKGHGTPCLYIHGGPGSGSRWLEIFSGEMLEQRFTMIYLDQRGVGRSGTPADGNYSMERMIMDFEEVRKELAVNQWFTLGHSFGGLLQMGYARQHPEVIGGMIFLNATLSLSDSFCNSWLPEAMKILERAEPYDCRTDTVPLMERLDITIEELFEKDLFWKMSFANKENQQKLFDTYSGIEQWNGDFSSRALEFDDYWVDYIPETVSVKCKVLWFYGKYDKMAGAKQANMVRFPNIIRVKSKAGHFPFLEAEADLANAIDKYLRKL